MLAGINELARELLSQAGLMQYNHVPPRLRGRVLEGMISSAHARAES
jgi:hypothetical protein